MTGSRTKSVIKGCSLGCGALLLMVAVGALWLARTIGAPAGELEISDYHPFKSAAAQERFLSSYDERAKAWPVRSDNRMVETSWGRTFVRISGSDGSPPLVLLPGANGTSLQWQPNVAALSTTRRVYAVDNIYDFGRSVYTRRFTSAEHFVDWLDELLTALELGDEVALMGLSYGGWISSQYALAHPERLDRVVLVAPAGTVLSLSSGFIKRAILAAIPHRYFVRNLIHWLAEDSLHGDAETRRILDDFIEEGYLGLRSFKFKQLVNPHVLSDEELASLAMPILFLVGDQERIYSASEAVERLARVAPQIETELVPGAGHDLSLARADWFNQRVQEFLSASDGERDEQPQDVSGKTGTDRSVE